MNQNIHHATKESIIESLRTHEIEIRQFHVKELALFGSYLFGESKTDSDVDILVDFEEKTFDNYMDLKFFLEELLQRKVDLVIKDALKTRIKESILKEAERVPGL